MLRLVAAAMAAVAHSGRAQPSCTDDRDGAAWLAERRHRSFAHPRLRTIHAREAHANDALHRRATEELSHDAPEVTASHAHTPKPCGAPRETPRVVAAFLVTLNLVAAFGNRPPRWQLEPTQLCSFPLLPILSHASYLSVY